MAMAILLTNGEAPGALLAGRLPGHPCPAFARSIYENCNRTTAHCTVTVPATRGPCQTEPVAFKLRTEGHIGIELRVLLLNHPEQLQEQQPPLGLF